MNGFERFLRGADASAAARVGSAGAASNSGAASAAGAAGDTAKSVALRSKPFTYGKGRMIMVMIMIMMMMMMIILRFCDGLGEQVILTSTHQFKN